MLDDTMNLYSYIVKYDSGFAPNPFYGYCTLATCKPEIRKTASTGDWIIGVSSTEVSQKKRLVYAMEITEYFSFDEYFRDQRFKEKKPFMKGSRKQARGDNIYFKAEKRWNQLDSYHSGKDRDRHIERDTRVNKVLISDKYVYFGADGPLIPFHLKNSKRKFPHRGRGYSKFSIDKDEDIVLEFLSWFSELNVEGFFGKPNDWND